MRAETVVSAPVGEALTHLLLKLSLRAGAPVRPRMDAEGAHLPLEPRFLDGSGEVSLAAEGTGTRVTLEGAAPPWPLRVSWAERKLRHLVRGWGDGTVRGL